MAVVTLSATAAVSARTLSTTGNGEMFYINEAKRLARRGRLIEMMGLVHERVDEGFVDDPKAFLAVVGIHPVRTGFLVALEQRRLPYVLEFCTSLCDLGVPARDYLGKQCLQLVVSECTQLLQENRLEDCIRALEKLAKCGFSVKNLVKPTSCMQSFARMHSVELALRYADLLPDLLQSYNMIMQQFRDQGDLQSVFRVFRAFETAGVHPDMYSYCILIDACGRCGQPATAAAVFEKLLEAGTVPNVYVCNSMMNACSENIQHVLRLYRQMECSGIAADLTTFNIILKACRLTKNPGIALRVYQELKEKEMELNVLTYGTLIQIFGEAKMLGQAFRIKHDMDIARVQPNVVTWTSLIGACAKAALIDKALQVFQDMLDSGCPPNAYTYNFLLSACVDGGQNEKAFKLFNEWKTTGKILPDFSSEEQQSLSYEFVQPDSVAYNTVLRACGNSPERVEEFMEEMECCGHKPDKRSWSILINAYGNRRDKQGAIRAFNKMEKLGIKADVVTYTDIIKACVNSMDISSALIYFEAMKRAKVSPNSVTYNALLRAKRSGDLGNVQRLLSIYEEMRENGWPSNERILKSLIGEWAEEVIRGSSSGDPESQMFRDYGESILRKVSVTKNPTESFVVDLQGLSKAEARAAILIVLRMMKEQHSRMPVEEDLIIVTGPSRQNEKMNVLQDVVTQVLENQLSLPVENSAVSDAESELVAIKPVTLGRLKVCKEAMNDWIQRKS